MSQKGLIFKGDHQSGVGHVLNESESIIVGAVRCLGDEGLKAAKTGFFFRFLNELRTSMIIFADIF